MGFLGVYKAIYDYIPQSEGELQISEGDLLYVLDKNGDDDWWKAKKKADGDDDDEPVGLIPNNYVEESPPVGSARALYDYTRQTDEELSFPEDATLQVFDTSDPDWILVGLDNDYGFAPSNYIEMSASDVGEARQPDPIPSPPMPPSLPARPTIESPRTTETSSRSPVSPISPSSPSDNPAMALANVMGGRTATTRAVPPTPIMPRQSETPEASDEEDVKSPALPARPRAQVAPRTVRYEEPEPSPESSGPRSQLTPGGFHMYNINEMVSVMGKRKKMPTTLGINLTTGTILIAPERTQDGPSQEWTADRMTHYSREGKHVFLELVRPSKSVDFHAGAKDTAEEIVGALGELAGAVRAEGLREVIMAGTGHTQKRGQVLYDFMAQGDDEVTVAVGDEVIILDDTKSEEWWQVRRLKNGKEGVVPSSYIEVTGTVTPPPATAGLNAAKSTVEQNRLEEIRLTKEAVKVANQRDRDAAPQVGPGMPLPERGSSLSARESGNSSGQQRSKRDNAPASHGGQQKTASKSKPDPSKVRTWTDRSKSFRVEAQFLGLKDGKINLHKMNGVKIAVPITKMSLEDLEYVEQITGISLDDDKPLSGTRKAKPAAESASRSASGTASGPNSGAGATVEAPRKPEYDWFQFFLNCEVAVGLCERYAQAFAKESMDESVLPDVDASILRNLGLREGDIIKVMRTLDAKYGRTKKREAGDGEDGSGGGLFSGPGGALRNNTRKGRPAPAVTTSDVVDAKAFSQGGEPKDGDTGVQSPTSPIASAAAASGRSRSGFDDDAWDVKPAKQQSPPPASTPAAKPRESPAPEPTPRPQPPALTGSMQELSLLSAPLEPTRTEPPKPAEPGLRPELLPVTSAPAQQPGATPSFFAGVAHAAVPPESALAHPAGIVNGPLGSIQAARQRPAPPQMAPGAGTLMAPPPPSRPLSAPQTVQPSAFAPPQIVPQMTGVHPSLQGQPAPPGHSLNDINQARLQQQYAMQLQAQPTGLVSSYPLQAVPQGQGMVPFTTGVPQHPGFMQPMMTGIAPPPQQFPLMQPQPTGFPGQFTAPGPVQSFGQAPGSGINNFLPPPLIPERTGAPQPASFQMPQPTGFNTMPAGGSVPPPPAPLVPQQTGPAPQVRFGLNGDAKKLVPQPTGRRANLAAATPQNPFGF